MGFSANLVVTESSQGYKHTNSHLVHKKQSGNTSILGNTDNSNHWVFKVLLSMKTI
jgi:hypothetical protein